MLTRRTFLKGMVAMPVATRALFTGSFQLPELTGPYLASEPHAESILTQLHCHTTQSDGAFTPAEVVDFYQGAGYGALMITDHDMVTSQPDGITTKLAGNEISPIEQHIVSMFCSYTRGSETDAQTIIDAIRGAGGQAEISHPNWPTVGLSLAEMQGLTDYMGLDIHNEAIVMGLGADPTDSDGFALSEWDALLADRLVWGFAVDDLHVVDVGLTFDVGRTHVFAAENTAANVMAAIIAGRFVADVTNYGVTPGYPSRSHRGVRLTCPGATRIEAYGSGGALLTAASGTTLEYPFDPGIGYCRLVAVGDHTEPFSTALSDRWHVLAGTWGTAGGILSGTTGGAVLSLQRDGPFTAQVKVRLGSGDLGGLLFNVRQNGTAYYVAQMGASSLTLSRVYDGDLTSLAAASGVSHDLDTWYTLKLDYAAGLMRVKTWTGETEPDWMLSFTDTTWLNGAFGLRGNGTPEFDDLYIDGLRTYYQPIPV